MAKARTHKAEVDKSNGGKSPAQIRAQKCERSKARNAARKAARIKVADEQRKAWGKLTTAAKLAELDKRPGSSLKQRQRLMEVSA